MLGLSILLVGCSIGSQGVFYDEMDIKPTISVVGDSLIVKISQPNRNSALVLYNIDVMVDHKKKSVFIFAEQGIGREFLGTLKVNLKDYEITNPAEYSFFWIDPPAVKTIKLDVVRVEN